MYVVDKFIDIDKPLDRNYVIMGESGNTHQVTISNYPSCTCYDYQKYGRRCKHIFFVLLRIMKITLTTHHKKKFSDKDLSEMNSNTPPIPEELIYRGDKPKIKDRVEQKFDEGDLCPICLDSLENGKELDYCKYSCGKTIHKQCFKRWSLEKGKICVNCRGKWYQDGEEFYHKTVAYHPIKKNGDKNNNNKNGDKNNTNNNEIKNGVNNDTKKEEKKEIDNFSDLNDKINAILANACRAHQQMEEENKAKAKKRKGRRRYQDVVNEYRSKFKNKMEEEEFLETRSRSRSRSRRKRKVKVKA